MSSTRSSTEPGDYKQIDYSGLTYLVFISAQPSLGKLAGFSVVVGASVAVVVVSSSVVVVLITSPVVTTVVTTVVTSVVVSSQITK